MAKKKNNISKKNQTHIQHWLDQAVHFQLKKDFVSSEALLQKVLVLDENNAAAYHYLGLIAKEYNSLEAASSLLEKSIQLNGTHAEACYNYAVILDLQHNFSYAIHMYQQAIHLNKKMDEAWFNLATAYYKNHEPEKTSTALTSFFSITHHTKKVYPNIAKLYFDIGALDQGRDFCLRYFATSKPSDDMIWTYINMEQYQSSPETMLQHIQPYLEQSLNPELMMRIQSYKLIYEWQLGQWEACQQTLQDIQPWHPNIEDSPVNLSLRSYQIFITELLKHHANNLQEKHACQQDIYLIGDSHCLSNSNQMLTIEQQPYHAISKLLIGCKTFHLAQQHANKFKVSYQKIIQSIPNGSSIIMMLGEIDCRIDEGFLRALKTKGGDLSQLIEYTVSSYISFINQETQGKNLHIYIYGVPAPKLLLDATQEGMDLLKQVILFFNQVLQHYALQAGYKFIDIYNFTVHQEGITHGRYHIDDFHLLPKVIEAADILFIDNP